MKKLEPGASGDAPAEGDALDRLLSNARSDGLGARQVDELWSRVGPAALGGALDPKAGAGGAGATATGAIGVKTIAAILVGGGLVVGGLSHPWRAPSRPSIPPVTAAATASVPALAPASPGPAGEPLLVRGAPSVDVGTLPLASPPGRPSPRARPGAGAALDARPVDHAIARRFPAEDTPGSSALDGNSASHVAQAPAPPDSRTGLAAPSFAPAPNEGALLLRARQELASDPAGALALTDEHARRFPGGSLAPEREVLAIEALARLGRLPEARARLAALRERFPQSPHLARLDALVER